MKAPSNAPAVPVEASRVVDALGATWNVHQLYPHPAEQPAFQRAVEALRVSVHGEMSFEVAARTFVIDGADVPATRDGVERLARALFLHDIEVLRVVATPTPEEIVSFMDVLARDQAAINAGGGFPAALGACGVKSLTVRQRRLLVDDSEAARFDRDDQVREMIERAADPEQFAAYLMEHSGGDPARLAVVFLGLYLDTIERLEARDLSGRESIVMGFVETFFRLPDTVRPAIVEAFLAGKDDEPQQMFLDQFSGIELAELGPDISPGAFGLLCDYAKVSEDGPDARPEELLKLLDSARDVKRARQAVVQQVSEKLLALEEGSDPIGEAFRNIKAQLKEMPDRTRIALEVISGLVECEGRAHRFRRVLRIWTGRVAREVRSGRIQEANDWLNAVTADPRYPVEREEQVSQALVKLASAEVLRDLVRHLAEKAIPADSVVLLRNWGPAVTDQLVEYLGQEENPAYRRTLIDMIAETAKANPRPLAGHLNDSRWYVVRNLAIALGRTGRPQAAPALKTLLSHDDHRVRIEALRALVPLLRGDSIEILLQALRDPHERVRQAALTLLRNSDDPAVEQGLIAALDVSELAAGEKKRLIEILAGRESSTARAALEALASKVALRSSARELRDAARAALEGTAP